jgi:hypothetical protein
MKRLSFEKDWEMPLATLKVRQANNWQSREYGSFTRKTIHHAFEKHVAKMAKL